MLKNLVTKWAIELDILVITPVVFKLLEGNKITTIILRLIMLLFRYLNSFLDEYLECQLTFCKTNFIFQFIGKEIYSFLNF